MRIAQYLGDSGTWGDVNPETMREKGMGGRETALVQLSQNWAANGHEVINFVPAEEALHEGSASYVPNEITSDWLLNFEADVLVSWEEPRIFVSPDIRKNVKLKVVEMQVAHLRVQMHDHNINCDDYIDKYAVLSPWARDFLCQFEPGVTRDKVTILPNGIDIGRFPEVADRPDEPPYNFIYSSSPDRGLHHLLRLWPEILKRYPGSLLYVAYGLEHWIGNTRWSHNMQSEDALAVERRINQEGVRYLGKIGQDELARIQSKCDALLYPADTLQPTETGCITAIEAMAAGAVPVLTECDCLPTEFEGKAVFAGLPFNDEEYLETLFSLMDSPERRQELMRVGRGFAEQRSWDKIAKQWERMFEWNLQD